MSDPIEEIEVEEIEFSTDEMDFDEVAGEGQAFFDFVEAHEQIMEDLESDDPEDEDDEQPEQPDPDKSEKGSKKRLNECLSVLELADTAISFGLCFLAGRDPKERSEYQADEDYKKQMAEQMALCDWNPKVDPKYMLMFIALMAYGPSVVDAYKRRTASVKAKKAQKAKGVVEMEIDPETGDYFDPAEEVNPKPKMKVVNECRVCGKSTSNKSYCSRECAATGARAAREAKMREQENQSHVV